MNTETLSRDLMHFTGSECVYRHAIVARVVFTEGAKYLADQAGAYWLLDAIAIAQRFDAKVTAEEFQLWTLTVNVDQTAVLTCEDGNGHQLYAQKIEHTDFPLSEVRLYCTDNTILLPTEY